MKLIRKKIKPPNDFFISKNDSPTILEETPTQQTFEDKSEAQQSPSQKHEKQKTRVFEKRRSQNQGRQKSTDILSKSKLFDESKFDSSADTDSGLQFLDVQELVTFPSSTACSSTSISTCSTTISAANSRLSLCSMSNMDKIEKGLNNSDLPTSPNRSV